MSMESTASPAVDSYAGTVDPMGSIDAATEQTPESSSRYGGPMTQQLARTLCGVSLVVGLLVTAIALSATGLQRSEEALALAAANADAIASGQIGAAPETARLDALGGGGAPEPAAAPAPTASALTPAPTEAPTSKPTPRPTGAPTEPHPLNPRWFQTTHSDYQLFLDTKAESGGGLHDWYGANILCSRQGQQLCAYDAYCPTGQGAAPFHGGPPKLHNHDTLEETQWSPFSGPSGEDPTGKLWTQIGRLSADEGGTEKNNFIQCWKYDTWYTGNGVDIVDVWEAKNRMWILCCDAAPEDRE